MIETVCSRKQACFKNNQKTLRTQINGHRKITRKDTLYHDAFSSLHPEAQCVTNLRI